MRSDGYISGGSDIQPLRLKLELIGLPPVQSVGAESRVFQAGDHLFRIRRESRSEILGALRIPLCAILRRSHEPPAEVGRPASRPGATRSTLVEKQFEICGSTNRTGRCPPRMTQTDRVGADRLVEREYQDSIALRSQLCPARYRGPISRSPAYEGSARYGRLRNQGRILFLGPARCPRSDQGSAIERFAV